MSIQEAADLLKVSRNTIYRRIAAKMLRPVRWNPAYMKGGKVGIPRSQVEALLPKPEVAEDLARLPKPGP